MSIYPEARRGIRSVATRAGVSIATVSRALNKPDAVSADLRARIKRAIEEIGYVPMAAARALSTRRTRTIGAIIPTIDNAMFARGIKALEKYLVSKQYMLLLATNHYDLDVELEQARNLVSRGVDGLILRGDNHHRELRDTLATHDVPFVNVGVYSPTKPYASIGIDNQAAAHRSMMHLIELGHRRLASVVALQLNNDRASARVAGFKAALEQSGLSMREDWLIEVPYDLDSAREAARRLLRGPELPTGVACGNDVLAYGVLLECQRQGFVVPDDISVVGFDDLEWSRHLRPSLTTIQVPTDEIWQRAGEYVVRTLAGESQLLHHEVDFSLVVRDSTAPCKEASHS